MSFPICTLKAGTTITAIDKRFPHIRIATDHPDEGRKVINVIADLHAPNGFRVEITEVTNQGAQI